MGFVTWEWRGRSAANGAAALLASVAAIALSAQLANAQQAAQTTDQTKKAEEEKAAPAGATLLDKILVISRTGETAIESLASASHIGQEQLDRRMATTPNE
ncbi:TonB-dependent receptor, partial [Mesorhizobium sp. M7A.F.Ca.CA.002.04.1.1]